MVSRVRPWKAPVKVMMPVRLVAARAILMAFSVASAPVVKSTVLAGPLKGASLFNRSQSAI